MNTHTTAAEGKDHRGHEPQVVEVELNSHEKFIVRGEYTGRQLKHALGVPEEHALEQVIQHQFHPVNNDDKVHIRGGEKFVSHRGQGQSS